MVHFTSLLFWGWIMGLIVVGSNPSPYFGAFGLVVVAGFGCGILASYGGSFLSLVLFLIYLGGMLVVFAYSAALAAEPYPEGLGGRFVLPCVLGYLGGVMIVYVMYCKGSAGGFLSSVEELGSFCMSGGDVGGVALMYSLGGWLLVVSVWALFITLLVVLELTRGLGRGAVRVV